MNIEQNGMSENFDMPFCYAFLCEIRRKSDHVLRAEPVGIEILKSKRAVKLFCGSIVFYHLKIGVAGASFFALIEKTGTDLTT